MVLVVDPQGRVEIPAELQRKLGLTPGTVINMDDHDGQLTITPANEKSGLVVEDGRVLFYGKTDSRMDLKAFVDQSREEVSDKQSRP